ncbi:MAG: hypothetical protein NVS4B11_24370 [Ktedonobacteraceae bacterium]
MDEHPPPNRPRISLPNLGFAIVLGVGIGAAVGVSSHNPAVGIGIGAAIFIIWTLVDQINRRRQR